MTIKSWYMSLDDNARAIEAYENNISKFYHHNLRPNSTFQTGFYKKEKFSYIKSVKVVPTLVLTFIAVLGTFIAVIINKNNGDLIGAVKENWSSALIAGAILGLVLCAIVVTASIMLASASRKSLIKKLDTQEQELYNFIKTVPSNFRSSTKLKMIYEMYCARPDASPDVIFQTCSEISMEKPMKISAVMFDIPYKNDVLEGIKDGGIYSEADDMEDDGEEKAENKPVNPYLPADIESKTYEGSSDSEKDLQAMIGLDSVKEQVQKIRNRVQFFGQSNNGNHMAFMGGAGTGKTTVARIVTKILYDLKVIQKNQYVEISGDYLRAGDTARASAILDYAIGGVLFIDEAYLLYDKNGRGADATGVLLKAMEDRRSEFVVILAGYEEQMTKLIASNEGFQSRIKHTIYFPDYTVDEMLNIFNYFISDYSGKKYVLMPDAQEELLKTFALEKKSKSFGNARTVRNAVDSIMDNYADRCSATHNNANSIILEDVQKYTASRKIALQHELKNAGASNQLDESIVRQAELKSRLKNGSENPDNDIANMIGAETFKAEMDMLKNQKEFYGKTERQKILLLGENDCSNYVRVLTGYLHQLGYITENKYLDLQAEFLKGSYVGHTAKRAEAIVAYASGGVLLIRNLNMLNNSQDSYSSEALSAIMTALTDNPDVTVVIADTTSPFISSIQSNFTIIYELPVYNKQQLCQIFMIQSKADGFTLDQSALDKLNMVVTDSMKEQDIVSLYNTAKKNHINNYTEENKFILTGEDIVAKPKIKLNLNKKGLQF